MRISDWSSTCALPISRCIQEPDRSRGRRSLNLFFNTDAATLCPIALFIQADWVVKFVMLGLLLASIWVWEIIVGFGRRIGRLRRTSEKFDSDRKIVL